MIQNPATHPAQWVIEHQAKKGRSSYNKVHEQSQHNGPLLPAFNMQVETILRVEQVEHLHQLITALAALQFLPPCPATGLQAAGISPAPPVVSL